MPALNSLPASNAQEMSRALAQQAAIAARPRSCQIHLLANGPEPQMLVVNGSQLYHLPPELAARFDGARAQRDETLIGALLAENGLDAPPAIDDLPIRDPLPHAFSLAIAQKCNLGCGYCYAQQGDFGGPSKNMSLDTAIRAVDWLLKKTSPGGKINLAFLGGEPLANRKVLRAATEYAAAQATAKNFKLGFSITTNGTLLNEDDADFFETYGFAVTVSLDGTRKIHDLLRPFKNGAGSFDRIIANTAPLLKRQKCMQVSARVTVTPSNLDLPATLDTFIGMGFHSVGFSPLLNAPDSQGEMDAAHLVELLEAMIACGLAFEQHTLRGVRYPFANLLGALRELHRGTHRPYPCGAGAGYLGVSADGALSACHRFVDAEEGKLGDLVLGIDASRQNRWLAERHVHTQEPCRHCWARYLCGGGCHHEVLARGRTACDYIRSWLHYALQAYGRLSRLHPAFFSDNEPASWEWAPRPSAGLPENS